MIRRDDRRMLVLEERPHPDLIVADGLGDDRDIQLALEQRLHRPERAFDREGHLHLRVPPAEPVEERRQPVIAGVALRADAQDTRLTRAQPPHVFFGRPISSSTRRAVASTRSPAAVTTMRFPRRRKSGVPSRLQSREAGGSPPTA